MIEITENVAVAKYENYTAFDNAFREEIEKHEESFVRIGYLLKVARDTDVLKSSGYKTVFEYAKDLYGLDATTVSRYIGINDTYSIEGYSPELDDKYKSFGYAKLSEMLTLPPAIVEELEPEMTREDIRTIKKEYQEEQKISDIEVAIERAEVINNKAADEREGKPVSLYEPNNNMEKLLYGYFHDQEHAEEFACLVTDKPYTIKELYEWIAPSGTRTIIGRVPGEGRLQLTLKSPDQKVSVINYRSGETEYYMWDDVTDYINRIAVGEEDGRKRYEVVFGDWYPVTSHKEEQEEKAAAKPEEKPKQKKVEVVKQQKAVEKSPKAYEKDKKTSDHPENISASEIMAKPEPDNKPEPAPEQIDKAIPAEAWHQRFMPYYEEWNEAVNRCSDRLYDIERKEADPKQYLTKVAEAKAYFDKAKEEFEKILKLPKIN